MNMCRWGICHQKTTKFQISHTEHIHKTSSCVRCFVSDINPGSVEWHIDCWPNHSRKALFNSASLSTLKVCSCSRYKKMYRQVMVHEADRNSQLVVWRRDPSESLKIFKLNTVTYGTSPAPFLAIRCLTRFSELVQDSHPGAAEVIRNDFYVDDMLTGEDTVDKLQGLQAKVAQVLL